MTGVYSHSVSDVLTRLKSALKIKRDADLAKLMNIGTNRIGNWKARQSIPVKFILTFCEQNGLDSNYILKGIETLKEPSVSYNSNAPQAVFDNMLLESYQERIKTLESLNAVLTTSNAELNANLANLQTKLMKLQEAMKTPEIKEKAAIKNPRKS